MGRVVFQQSPFIVAQNLQNKIYSLFVEFLHRRKEFANAPVKSWAGAESNRPEHRRSFPDQEPPNTALCSSKVRGVP